jgi:hypothetical protein
MGKDPNKGVNDVLTLCLTLDITINHIITIAKSITMCAPKGATTIMLPLLQWFQNIHVLKELVPLKVNILKIGLWCIHT